MAESTDLERTARPDARPRVVRHGVAGMEIYTRISLYGSSLIEALLAAVVIAAVAELSQMMAAVLGLCFAVHIAACVWLLRLGLLGAPLASRRALAAAGVGAIAALAAAAIATWASEEPSGFGGNPGPSTLLTLAVFSVAAFSPWWRARQLLAASAVATCLIVAWRAATVGTHELAAIAIISWLTLVIVTLSYRLSFWILEVVRELDASRDAHARLAVAEERLRISRDLHDVFGRTLAAIAVKSELASELGRRGEPAAVEQMREVHQIAQDATREVRAVVQGYRRSDLDSEVAGATSVLAAAGVSVQTRGSAAGLDDAAHEALGWVVREGVTNVLRHSRATRCVVTLAHEGASAVLRITNDGAPSTSPPRASEDLDGSGLRGLEERLAALGGSLRSSRDGEEFSVEARVPSPSGAAS